MEEWEAREQSEQRSGSARASICCEARRESRVYQSALGYFVKRREFGLLSHYWRAWADACISAECSAYTADAPWQHQTQLRESQRKRVETKQKQYCQQAYTSSCGDTLTVETLTPNGSIKYTSTACNFSSVKGVVRDRQEDAVVKRRNAPLACLIQADECMMVQVPFKGNSNLHTHNNPAIKPHPMTWCSGRKW